MLAPVWYHLLKRLSWADLTQREKRLNVFSTHIISNKLIDKYILKNPIKVEIHEHGGFYNLQMLYILVRGPARGFGVWKQTWIFDHNTVHTFIWFHLFYFLRLCRTNSVTDEYANNVTGCTDTSGKLSVLRRNTPD